MQLRDKFLNCMRRKDGSYIPYTFALCPSQLETFYERLGKIDFVEYFQFPTRGVGLISHINQNERLKRFSKYYDNLNGIMINNDWGYGDREGSLAHFTKMIHPMESFETLEEFENFPYPDPDKDYSFDHLKDAIEDIKKKGFVAVPFMTIMIFETAWYLRGFEKLMFDMVMNPELANYHLDRITSVLCKCVRKFAEAGVDMISMGDDVSTQIDMMMSPDMWRRFLKPRLEAVIDSAKQVNPDILINYHGDGNLQKIIPDLISAGVDILNPVQPECMDPVLIKQKYGDRLSLWGTLGTQSTLPFGTPDDVRMWCEKMIKEVGYNGGLCLAPTHLIEPEVPFENIMAFIETVQNHNNKFKDHNPMLFL